MVNFLSASQITPHLKTCTQIFFIRRACKKIKDTRFEIKAIILENETV